jgi:hypothetical protein
MKRLKLIGEGLYYAEADVGFYGVDIQTRMFVAVLEDGAVWVCSPLILTDDLANDLAALGSVRYVLSPNKIHNQGLSSFAERYPDAAIWASPGLMERRNDIHFKGTLGDRPESEWRADFEQLTTDGNVFFSEVVFFHTKSKTLIVADLIENVTADTFSGKTGEIAAKAMHIFGKPLPSPEFRLYTLDPDAAREKLDTIAAWPFERIVLAHGDFIEENAHDEFRSVSDYLIAETSSRPEYRRAMYRYMATKQ